LVDLNDATKKQAKLLVFSKEAHKLISNFKMELQKTQEKELCKTSSVIKSRGHTTCMPCLELEGAFSPKTRGVLITPWVRITSPSLSFGGPSTAFLLQ
jgi:hypothetical protein